MCEIEQFEGDISNFHFEVGFSNINQKIQFNFKYTALTLNTILSVKIKMTMIYNVT